MKNPCLTCDYHHYLVKKAVEWQKLDGYRMVGQAKNAECFRRCKRRYKYLAMTVGDSWGVYYNPGAQCSTADDVEVNFNNAI